MNYTGMSKSNYVEVTDKQRLQDLVHEARETDRAYFQTYWLEGKFAIGADNGPMRIDQDDDGTLDWFFEELAECIGEPMIVRNVGFEGMRYTPDAWQWVVYPDGTWTYDAFDDAHTVKEQYESEELSGMVANE